MDFYFIPWLQMKHGFQCYCGNENVLIKHTFDAWRGETEECIISTDGECLTIRYRKIYQAGSNSSDIDKPIVIAIPENLEQAQGLIQLLQNQVIQWQRK